MVEASDLASVAMATFGLTTDEIATAMDFMVRAADASVAEVSGLRDAMTNVGSSAASMGMSIEDITTALALLSTRGIVGAEAGTALKSMMTNLMRVTPAVTEALEENGISLYDNSGQMLSMVDIIGQFQIATESMTAEQKNQFIQTVAGTYGMKSLATFLSAGGVQGWQDMEVAIASATGIQTQAEAAAATYGGQMEALGGNIETLKIRIGTALLPAMTNVIGVFSVLIDQYGPDIVAVFEAVGERLSDLTAYLGDLFTKYQEGGLAAVLNIPQNVIDAISTVRDVIGQLFGGEMEQGLLRIQLAIQNAFGIDAAQKFNSIRVFLNETIPQAVEKAEGAMAVIKDLFGLGPDQSQVDEQRERWVGIMGGTEIEKPADKLRDIIGGIGETFTKVFDFISANGDTIKDIIVCVGAGLAAFSILSTIIPVVVTFIGVVSTLFGAGGALASGAGILSTIVAILGGPLTIAIGAVALLIAAFAGNVGGFRDKVMPVFEAIAKVWTEDVMPALTEAWDAIKEAFGSIGEIFKKTGDDTEEGGSIIETVIDVIVAAIKVAAGIISGVMTTVAGMIKFFADAFAAQAGNMKGIIEGIKGWVEGIKELFSAKSWKEVGAALGKIFKNIGKALLNFGKMVLRGITMPFKAVLKFVGKFVTGIIKFFTNLKDKIVGKSIVPDMMEAIQDIIEKVLDAVGDFIEKALNAIAKVFEDVFNAIRDTVDKVMAAVQTIIEKVTNAVQNVWDRFTAAVQKAWEDLWAAVQEVVDKAKLAVESAVSALRTAVERIWNTFMENLRSAWNTLWTNLVDGLSSTWANIQEAISTGIANALQVLIDAVGSFLTAGANLVNAIRDGIVNTWNVIITAISTGLTAIGTFITNALNTIRTWGASIVTGIKEGLQAAWKTLVDAFGILIDALGAALKIGGSLIGKVMAWGTNIVNAIKTGVATAWSTLTASIGTLLTDLANGTLWNNIKAAGENIVDALIQGIKDHWQNFIDWLLDAIKGIFGGSEPTNVKSPFRSSFLEPRGAAMMERFWKGAMDTMPKLTMDMQSVVQPGPVALPPQSYANSDYSRHVTVEVNPTYANTQSEASVYYDVVAALQSVAM